MGVRMKIAQASFIAVIIGSAACEAEGGECPKDLKLIAGSMPEYPSPEQAAPYLTGTSYMHVFVEGTIVVAYTVDTSGVVIDARIVKSNYKPAGRSASRYQPGYFDGFLEMNVLPALKTWRHPPRAQPCDGKFTFTYQLGAKQTAARGRAKSAAREGDNVTNAPHMFDNVVVVPMKFRPKN